MGIICIRNGTCPKSPLVEAAKTMDLNAVQNLEVMNLKPPEPWRQPAFKSIDIEKETVVYVLVDCPHLQELRQELRSKIGDAFNKISVMLGGKPHGNQERKCWSINTGVMNAVLDFAQASQRFQSRQSRWVPELGPQAEDQISCMVRVNESKKKQTVRATASRPSTGKR
jgi:hypothetical protein